MYILGVGLGGRAGIEGGRCRLIQIISSMASSMFDNTPWTSIINQNWYHGSRQALKSKKSLTLKDNYTICLSYF